MFTLRTDVPEIGDKDLEKLKSKSRVGVESKEHAEYMIPKDHVETYFTYGKPQKAIAAMLGKELAKDAWNIDEQEAVDENVKTMARDWADQWKVVVYTS